MSTVTLRLIMGLLVAALTALSLGSCTVVEVYGSDGRVTVERHAGIVSIGLRPADSAQIVSATGIGFIVAGGQAVLGYHDMDIAALGNDCRLVLWIEQEEQLTAAHALFGERQDFCAVPHLALERE